MTERRQAMQCGCGKLIGWRMGGKCLACRYREAKMTRRVLRNETRTCTICTAQFAPAAPNQKCCSEECSRILHRRHMEEQFEKKRQERAEKLRPKPAKRTRKRNEPTDQKTFKSVIQEERKSEAPKAGLRCNPARLRKPLLPPTKDRAKTVKEEPDIMYEEAYHGFMQEPERYASHGEFGRLNNPRAYSEEDLEVIRQMSSEGATNTAIGMKLGRNPGAIKQKIQTMKRLGDL